MIVLINNPFKKPEDYLLGFFVYISYRTGKNMKVFFTIVLITSTSLKIIFFTL